jgi:uncharacterized OB-fold protein
MQLSSWANGAEKMDNADPYPLPRPTLFTSPFWDACQRESLELPVCNACKLVFLPGGPLCPGCRSQDLGTEAVSGLGQVFSFGVFHRTYHPAIPAPYVVAIIELLEGARLVSNIVDCEPGAVFIGMKVQVVFEEESGFMLPRFFPVPATTSSIEPGVY